MHAFCSAPYLVALFTMVSAAPSYLLPSNSTFPSLLLHTPQNKETQCRNPRESYWYLSTADCLEAIKHLPSTHAPGTFHVLGENDDFRLPRGVTYRNCHLEVDLLREHTEETSDWDVVRQAARELVRACVKRNMESVNKGGYTTAGPRDAVYVKLQKPERKMGLPPVDGRIKSVK